MDAIDLQPSLLEDPGLRPARITALFCTLTAIVYGALQLEPSSVIVLFFSFGPLFTIILWLQQEAKRNGIGAVADFGLFIWIAWPILIAWYVLKTRGRAGWRFVLELVAVIISADLGWMIGAWGVYSVRYSFLWGIYGVRYLRYYLHI